MQCRQCAVELAESSNRKADAHDLGSSAYELPVRRPRGPGGEHGLGEAPAIEGLGELGGVVLHAAQGIEAPAPARQNSCRRHEHGGEAKHAQGVRGLTGGPRHAHGTQAMQSR